VPLPTIEWIGEIDGKIKLIDQTLLPNELKYVYCDDKESIYHASLIYIINILRKGCHFQSLEIESLDIILSLTKSVNSLKSIIVR